MKIHTFLKVTLFLRTLSTAESKHLTHDFNISVQHKYSKWTDVSSNFAANTTQSAKSIFTSEAPIFLDDQQENRDLKVSTPNLTVLFSFSVVAALSVLINVRVFYIVFITSKRRSRPANILVAHLSYVVIVFTFVFYIYVLEKTNVVSLTGPRICNVFAFLRNNIFNVFPINAGAVIWVRTRSDAIILRKSFAYRFISVMWAITIVGNLPSTFMVQFMKRPDNQQDKCKEIPLLGSVGATIAYESVRFLLFTVMVCLYIIRATIKLRSSIKHIRVLKLIHNEKMMKRLQHVRFVYLHTFVFVLNWFPNGLGLLLYKIFSRLGWTTDYVNFLTPIVFLNYSVFILCPLSYVFLMKDMSIAKIFLPCFRRDHRTNYVENVENNEKNSPHQVGCRSDRIKNPNLNKKPKDKSVSNKAGNEEKEDLSVFEVIEMSLMTTVGYTGKSGNVAFNATKIKTAQEPINVQASSIPSILTRTTAAKLKSFEVQIQVEREKIQNIRNVHDNRRHPTETPV